MAEFVSFSPRVEVLGQAVLSIMGGMELIKQRALRILGENGISSLEPNRWYPQQNVLNALKLIFEKIGPSTVRTIGRKIPETAEFPPFIDSIEKALASIDMAYRMNHRGAEWMGAYRLKPIRPRQVALECENPYPCDMDLGLIEGMADRFRPADSVRIKVEHDPGGCRRKGAEACTYHVSW
jgi:hypothetical protein